MRSIDLCYDSIIFLLWCKNVSLSMFILKHIIINLNLDFVSSQSLFPYLGRIVTFFIAVHIFYFFPHMGGNINGYVVPYSSLFFQFMTSVMYIGAKVGVNT